ncbi:hypothetical protein BDZ89DRAFT_332766 [Hymenopellis radicata]|nr:hypothetical protein BDZ89DRAFT_332766 [Hymenopellis radicata]
MQETSTLELHPFGDLPVDIARIIFEIAASLIPTDSGKVMLGLEDCFPMDRAHVISHSRPSSRAEYHGVCKSYEISK